MSYLVFTDVETTGLDTEEHEILSIGIEVVRADTYEPIAEHEWYVLPEHIDTASPRALEVNGYTAAKWAERGARPVAEVFREIAPWLRRGLFAGHNCPFDIGFIWATAARLGTPGFPKHPWSFLDTRQLSLLLSLDKSIPNNKLDSLCEHFDFPRGEHHGALEDAKLSRKAAQEIYERYKIGARFRMAEVPPPTQPEDETAD